jgi:Fe-Mn family superoxide dismutase
MTITLPKLPYSQDALAPHIGQRTLEFHHGNHHAAYVTNANKLLEGTDLANEAPEAIIRKTAGDASKAAIFNNVAQAWNHAFYWQCMKSNGGERISRDFGSYEKFCDEFKNAGATQFGSGWAWLVLKENKLQVIKTSNADTPVAQGATPLLTVDVWEHAYYLDYQNRRADYLKAFIDKMINWEFVNTCLG